MNRLCWWILGISLIVVAIAGTLASRRFLGEAVRPVTTQLLPQARANRLVHEKSPYLLQHAHNPVDWYPWGAEAFARAKREDKPIFLSIGYSTCHWCHVMEHESFENPAIARLLNDYFVSIKVDREERPDLDQIYMTATQTMTGAGGWPMSVWLNHELQPFFTGTYFPPESRYGRPGFADVLQRIHEVWTGNRAKVDGTARSLAGALEQQMAGRGDGEAIPSGAVAEAWRHFEQTFDARFGGFGNAPKFPRAAQFPFLFRHHATTGDQRALDMALFTLQKMAQGGIYDQLGGGFSRYSVDAEWRVPHFEKMLYDNGQLLAVYAEAWQITRDDFYQDVARDIIRYLARDMTAPGGAFYSAEDADSEGVEGTFYVWTEPEVRALLGDEAARVVMSHYDFRPEGNFEHGKNVLHAAFSIPETARKTGKTEAEAQKIIADSKARLFAAREKRPRPYRDDKIITAWNGLMITGLAKAGRAFGEDDFIGRGARAANFILKEMRDPKTGHLVRRHRDGESKGAAFLDDYAFFTAGLLELFEADQDPRWLEEAARLTDEQIRLFWDGKQGGFFFATADDPTLLLRPKSDYEGAEPSGNAIAVRNLLRLAQLTGRHEYREKAELTLKALSGNVRQFPSALPMLLCALSDSLGKPRQIVIAGDLSKMEAARMWREVNQHYLPNTILLRADGGKRQAELAKRLPFLAEIKPRGGRATAYICQDYTCQSPITEVAALVKALEARPERKR